MEQQLKGKDEFNPVEKNFDIYLYGIPNEIIINYQFIDEVMSNAIKLSKANIHKKIVEPINPGASGVYLLTESEAAWHTTPETIPNFMSFKISTCGNKTHPILCLKYILEKLNAISGKISYYKEGYDIAQRKSGFPKTISIMIKKYYDQFDVLKYRFEAQEAKQLQYDFYFSDPLKLTQKIAAILGIEWPLNDETKKLGIYLDDKEFQKNGNVNGEKR